MEPPRQGPEVPILNRPEDSKLINWFLAQMEIRSFIILEQHPKGSMHTYVESSATGRATLSIKHSYVRVLLNGVPVIASANWWSSDWNVQVNLERHKPNTSPIP